jgi:hypothetical protein
MYTQSVLFFICACKINGVSFAVNKVQQWIVSKYASFKVWV